MGLWIDYLDQVDASLLNCRMWRALKWQELSPTTAHPSRRRADSGSVRQYLIVGESVISLGKERKSSHHGKHHEAQREP